jgi:hypothetical protein
VTTGLRRTKRLPRLPASASTATTISLLTNATPGAVTPARIPVNMVHNLSDALLARAEGLRDMAQTIRQYEPLSLESMQLVGNCLKKSGELCDAWEAVVKHLMGRG